MLRTTASVKTPTVERLLNLWAQRYTPDLSFVPLAKLSSYSPLIAAASQEGRALTADKLKDQVLNVHCQMAWVQTKTLYNYIPNILDLNEARRITQFAFRVYRKLVEIYQHQSVDTLKTECPENSVEGWGILPAIDQLAYALEPILMVFQEQHLASKDWRCLGFMTTQINFSNKLILKKLTPAESVLLSPYLKFVEEQVAMPWHRICTAAAKYELDTPKFLLVEKMLPASVEVAQAVYRRLIELLPNYQSRRGGLTHPEVTHSCLRDLNMFQAYIWLCFLEESLATIEQELLPLCEMVVAGVDIKWEITEKWYQLLADELLARSNPQQQAILQPYVQGLKEIFFKERFRLGFRKQPSDVPL